MADDIFGWLQNILPVSYTHLVQPAHWSGDVDTLADMVVKTAQPGDHILVMSNGGFGGIHQKLLDGLDVYKRQVIA